MELSSRALKLMQYLVGALMALTVVLLVWHRHGMERVIELTPTGPIPYRVFNDASDQGASIVRHKVEDGRLKVDCTLVRQFEWPYCSVRFMLGQGSQGIDLSDFDTLTLDVRHSGPGAHKLRLYLRNFDPGSSIAELNSQRVNEIEFEVPDEGELVVPFDLLRTATWWVKLRNRSLMDTRVRMDNVTTVELSSGVANELGPHHIEVRAIRLSGKWISQNHLLMFLVAAWFTCGIIWPLVGALHLRAQLRAKEARLAMLSALNQALQLETRELAGQAYIDPLTGALNRQGLRDLLVRQWQDSTLPEHGSIIFVDLDHFKQINDTHGHPAGDDVLRRFAAMVREEIRSTDKLVRWGGEEFLIVCPSTSAAHAEQLAEKLRTAMARRSWPCGLQVTASFGVTALARGEDIGDAIKRADDALYRAKKNGRNRVEVAPHLSVQPVRAAA